MALVPILLLPLLFSCSDDDSSDSKPDRTRTQNPPVVLDADTVSRTVAALTDLSVAYQKQLADQTAANPGSPAEAKRIGMGFSFAVDRGEQVIRVHGFKTREEFEVAFAHVMRALSVALLGEFQGFDGAALQYQLDNELQIRLQDLEATRRDQALSADARRVRITELESEIASIRARAAELKDVASARKADSAGIPQQNIDEVAKHKDVLLAILGAPR